MKNILLVLLLVLSQAIYGQLTDCLTNDTATACCNGIIHTGPDTTKSINLEKPSFRNRFDWREDDLKVYQPLGGYTDGVGGPALLPNPFKTTDDYLSHINYYNVPIPDRNPSILDYYPEDGWELLHRNLGYKPDETTYASALENRYAPYIILYNKYTGLFRVIAALDETSPQAVNTQLLLEQPAILSYKLSGIFGYYGTDAQTLDEKSYEKISVSSTYPGRDKWFVADFTLSYDPCVCLNDSRLTINFQTITTSSVTMDGRFIATSVPLNISGNTPLLNGEDFLLGVNQDGFDVQGGMQTYSNIDSVVKKFKAPAGLNTLEKEGLNLVGRIIKDGLKGFNPLVDRVLTNAATALAYQFARPDKILEITGNDSVMVGIDFASKASEFFMTAVKEEAPPTPNMSVIEGELKLTGQIQSINFNSGFNISLEQPGSKSSLYNSPTPASDWKWYPAYNEALGIIGVLEQPHLRLYTPAMAYNMSKADRRIMQRHFELESFKYTFNPAPKVDTTQTQLLYALSGKFKSSFNTTGNFRRVPDLNNSDTNIFVTDFFPAECLHGYIDEFAYWDDIEAAIQSARNDVIAYAAYLQEAGYEGVPYVNAITERFDPMIDAIASYHPGLTIGHLFEESNLLVVKEYEPFKSFTHRYFGDSIMQIKMLETDLRLKVLINYTFEENQYGKVNRSMQNLTFKSTSTLTHPLMIPPYNKVGFQHLNFITVYDSTQLYPNRDTTEAWEMITVAGDNIAWPLLRRVLRAPELLIVNDGAIGNDVTLQNITRPTSGCKPIRLGQVSPAEVKDFCQSTTYKAGEPLFKNDPINTLPPEPEKKSVAFQLLPNPTTSEAKVFYSVNGQDMNVRISIMDITGRELLQPFNGNQSNGNYSVNMELQNLSAGVYFVTLAINETRKTERLVISK